MREVVHILINPLLVFLVLILLAGGFYFLNRRKTAQYILIFSITLFSLVSTSFFPDYFINKLESHYSGLDLNKNAFSDSITVNILVLGAGYTLDPRIPANSQLSKEALGRLIEGIRLHQQIANSQLIFSGWSKYGLKSQAEVYAEAAILLGVSSEKIKELTSPSNTKEEAIAYLNNFNSKSPLILVTSANHMSRSIMHFEEAGLNPIPSATNFILKRDASDRWIGQIFPNTVNLSKTNKVLHEYIGWYHGKYEWWVEEKKKK